MRLALALVLPALVPTLSFAAFPERPVTAVVGYPGGGLADVTMRAVVEGMKKKFPKGIAVVNRTGAGGSIGASEVVQSKPDGYMVGLMPISNLVIQPQVLDRPFRTPDEFIAAAQAAPGKLRVGTPGERSSSAWPTPTWCTCRSSAGPRAVRRCSGATSRRWWRSPARCARSSRASACGCSASSSRPATPTSRTRPRGRKSAIRSTTAPGSCWSAQGHDAAKAAMEDASFVTFAKTRVIDVDYRAGDRLRADLWQEYKAHTEILKRIGMLRR